MYSPLEQFELVRIGGVITNSMCIMGLTISWLVLIWQMTQRGGGKRIIGSWQGVFGNIYKQVLGLVYDSIGRGGGKYVGIILSLMLLITSWNLIGLIPYSYTITAQLVITMTLSLGVWIGKLLIGLRKQGIKLLGMFIPAGAPFGMVPFFVLVELIGFVIPLISLGVRLFANMMSGHILMKVLFGFTWIMWTSGGILGIVEVLPMCLLLILMGLETGVSIIQGFVFSLLTSIYIGEMERGGH